MSLVRFRDWPPQHSTARNFCGPFSFFDGHTRKGHTLEYAFISCAENQAEAAVGGLRLRDAVLSVYAPAIAGMQAGDLDAGFNCLSAQDAKLLVEWMRAS